MRSFAPTERFVSEVQARKLKPAYVLVGDETFFRRQCREAILEHLVPPDMRDLSIYEFDLGETDIGEILDRARTPSLMSPFQVFFVRGVKHLYTRGSHESVFAAIKEYVQNPNPDAMIVFIADHIGIPADARRMELQDHDRYKRIRETLGKSCGLVELARVDEGEAVRWAVQTAAAQGFKLASDAARELADALGGNMMMLAGELDKLMLYAAEKKKIGLEDVEMMVLAAKQRSLYELTEAISARDRARALEILQALLSSGDGEDAAIGHLFMLAKIFRQMLVIQEKNIRDAHGSWRDMWPGFRLPPFAAEDVIRQARRYTSRRHLTRALRLIARADLELRSSPPSKRIVLEKLVLELAGDGADAPVAALEQQQTLPV